MRHSWLSGSSKVRVTELLNVPDLPFSWFVPVLFVLVTAFYSLQPLLKLGQVRVLVPPPCNSKVRKIAIWLEATVCRQRWPHWKWFSHRSDDQKVILALWYLILLLSVIVIIRCHIWTGRQWRRDIVFDTSVGQNFGNTIHQDLTELDTAYCRWNHLDYELWHMFRLLVSGQLQKESDFYACFVEGDRTVKEFCQQVCVIVLNCWNDYLASYWSLKKCQKATYWLRHDDTKIGKTIPPGSFWDHGTEDITGKKL